MNPMERTLQVLEYVMAAGSGPVKQTDIARHCGLSPANLCRIVKTLLDWGYLFRTKNTVFKIFAWSATFRWA